MNFLEVQDRTAGTHNLHRLPTHYRTLHSLVDFRQMLKEELGQYKIVSSKNIVAWVGAIVATFGSEVSA